MKTPISHQFNLAHGARFSNFADWQMPTFYTSVIQEHKAVRERFGLFDVSHMGRWIVEGPEAQDFLDALTTNDLSITQSGRALYTLLLNDSGGIIDDLIIYKINQNKFLVVNNAGNHDAVTKWFLDHSDNYDLFLEDITRSFAQIAIQGPAAKQAVEELLRMNDSLKYFNFVQFDNLLVAATGYTGEAGYEIYGEPDRLMEIWAKLLDLYLGLPCGLGSRDLLRLESGYLLHGSDMDSKTSPYEAGLSWVVKLSKDFIGKEFCTIMNKKLFGLKFNSKVLPRHGMEVFDSSGVSIGIITSGNFSPTLNIPIAFAYLPVDCSDDVSVRVREAMCPAMLSTTRFYQKKL